MLVTIHPRFTMLGCLGLAAASALLSSCATSGSGSGSASRLALSNPTVESPVVAVLPFSYTNSSDAGENNMRGFESHYFPARLVSNLRATPGIKAAYFSPSVSPAADYNVQGSIVTSNGRTTAVSVKACDATGKQLWLRQFSVTAGTAEFDNGGDPAGRIWSQVAQALVKTKQKPGALASARVTGYTKNKAITVNDKSVEVANKGAEVERNQLLDIYTKRLLTTALSSLPVQQHLDWQRLSTPVVIEKNAAKAQMAMSLISGMATAGLGGYAAAQGAYTPQLSQAVSSGLIAAAGGMETASTKIEEANKTLSELNLQASVYKETPISVHIYGAVYSLKGLPTDQLQQLQNKISEKVSEAAAAAAPVPATADAAKPQGTTAG